jgi:hypothetical protein
LIVGVSAATLGLFFVSRGKWADAIIDTGNEWLWPDALARGQLLYRDVVYWFGPLTPYFHAAVFAVVGSSFASLALAGALASIAALAALYASLRLVTGRLEAALWSALAIPLLIFMPHSGGSLIGMGYRMWHAAALSLLALRIACAPGAHRWRPWVAGACVGLAALCRADWGLMTFVALAAALRHRGPSRTASLRALASAVAAAAAVFGVVMAPFVAAAGIDRFFTESFVFLAGLPEETRRSALGWTGLRRWPWGVWSWIYAAAVWLAAYGLVELAATRRTEPRRNLRKLAPAALSILAILAAGAILGPGAGSPAFAWAPVACAAAVIVGWRQRSGGAALVGYGIVGVFGLSRRAFDLRDFGYVAPPTLFALVCAAGLVEIAMRRESAEPARGRVRRFVCGALAVLLASAFLWRVAQYAADYRIPVPGAGGFLAAPPALAAAVELAARQVRERTPTGAPLVVFPDGAVLNYLSDRPNPLRHKLYVAGFLRSSNEEAILLELKRNPPAAVVILDRPDGHEPPRVFGIEYGSRVRRWLEERYDLRALPQTRPEAAGFPLLLGFPRSAAGASYNPRP